MKDKKTTKLPVRNKREENGKLFLVKPVFGKCQHYNGPFEVDMDAGKCICQECNEEVSPMFVLNRLLAKESRWMRSHDNYKDEMKRLAERSRTKCQHCGQMTRISGR